MSEETVLDVLQDIREGILILVYDVLKRLSPQEFKTNAMKVVVEKSSVLKLPWEEPE